MGRVKQHWRGSFKYGFFIACTWWALLFCIHLVYVVPHEIRATANAIPASLPRRWSIVPPEFAYLRTAKVVLPSFVLVAPGPVVNIDSWDFIVVHKGNEKVESIDMQLLDVDKLEHLRKVSNTIFPQEYSVFLHIDQMFPKNRGSLFAKQFIWKPFSFEHGHYTVNISTSTGRFHEELHIEKVKDKWAFAAKVEDIDSHDILYACRDKLFPASVASQIVANHKCWPEMVQ